VISVDEALKLIDQHRPDLGFEEVSLQEAIGRELYDDIFAPFSMPAFPTSVMDGYAFRKTDIDQEMIVVGESRAGQPFAGEVKPREALRIFTGAKLPEQLDHIEIQEYAVRDGERLKFSKQSKGRDYIRPAGSNFKKGDLLFQAGQQITPAVLAALASANEATIAVRRVPTIALLRCGDELNPVGSVLIGAQIIDSNGPYLTSLLRSWGFDVVDLGLVADDPKAIQAVLLDSTADIILPVGGASVGDYDFMRTVFLEMEFEQIFDRVAIKPGKPVWMSRRKNQIVLGLPGNPTSVFTCSHVFLSQLVRRSAQWDSYKLMTDLAANGARERYIPAKLEKNGRVIPLASRKGQMVSIAKADVLIQRQSFSDEKLVGESVDCLHLKY